MEVDSFPAVSGKNKKIHFRVSVIIFTDLSRHEFDK